MIVGTNNKIIIIKRVNFKEEAEDVEATTKQLIHQSQKMPTCGFQTLAAATTCGENEAFSDLAF